MSKVFSDVLESEQPVPWSVDVDTHHQLLCKTLSDAACTAFAKKGDKPKRPNITELTWHLVRFRIKVLRNPGVLACSCAFGCVAIVEQFSP